MTPTDSADGERRRLTAALKKERKAAERRVQRIRKELDESEEVASLERQGELLKANLRRVDPRAESVTVEDFETGEPVVIPIDPKPRV